MTARKVDKGTPPFEVLQEEEEYNRILYGNEEEEESVVVEQHIPHGLPPIPKVKPKPTEYVSLENDSLRFRFKVSDWCFTELALIFVLDPEQFNVEPKKDSSFVATFRGEEYPVIYIGGPLHFKNYGIHQIIFIRDISKEVES